MTKLATFPTREELSRLRERWQREDESDAPLRDFDTTLTSGIEGTINQMVRFSQRSNKAVEADALRDRAVQQLVDEVKSLRASLSQVVQTTNTKASKGQMRTCEKDLTARMDKRIDNLFKLLAAGLTVVGALIAYKGH